MTDTQIEVLRRLLGRHEVAVYYDDDGILVPVHCLQDNHREMHEPEELGEPVAWIGKSLVRNSKCVSLWNSDVQDFAVVAHIEVDWGASGTFSPIPSDISLEREKR